MIKLGLPLIIFLVGCTVDPPKPPLPDGVFKPVNVVESVIQQPEPVVVKKKAKKRKHKKVRHHGS